MKRVVQESVTNGGGSGPQLLIDCVISVCMQGAQKNQIQSTQYHLCCSAAALALLQQAMGAMGCCDVACCRWSLVDQSTSVILFSFFLTLSHHHTHTNQQITACLSALECPIFSSSASQCAVTTKRTTQHNRIDLMTDDSSLLLVGGMKAWSTEGNESNQATR